MDTQNPRMNIPVSLSFIVKKFLTSLFPILFSKTTHLQRTKSSTGLARQLPDHVVSLILRFLPLHNLLNYGNTSICNRSYVQNLIRNIIHDEILPFFAKPRRLQHLLLLTRSIISGSVPLAVLIPHRLREWHPLDLDICVVDKAVPKLFDYLIEEGYRVVGDGKITLLAANRLEAITEIIKFTRLGGLTVNLMIVGVKSSLTAIFKTYGSHLSNAITGAGIFCAYPRHTLEHLVIMNNARVPNFFNSAPKRFHKSVVKYAKRGFQFEPNFLLALSMVHECKRSKRCPHTRRNIFDNGCLAISIIDGGSPTAFVPNSMRTMWNGRYGNVWAFGGDPCNLEVEPLYAIRGFALETKIR
jgi:hypothetical protein